MKGTIFECCEIQLSCWLSRQKTLFGINSKIWNPRQGDNNRAYNIDGFNISFEWSNLICMIDKKKPDKWSFAYFRGHRNISNGSNKKRKQKKKFLFTPIIFSCSSCTANTKHNKLDKKRKTYFARHHLPLISPAFLKCNSMLMFCV